MIQRYWRFGGLMVSELVSRLSGPVLSTGFNTRHFTYTVPFSTQVYKWVSANLIQILTGFETHHLCDIGAELYQLSYQAIWELVTL